MVGPSPYRQTASDAAEWLLAAGIRTESGLAWPASPGQELDDSLYAGTPGVVLAMLTAHHSSGDERFLEAAQAAGRHLVEAILSTNSGLYTGVAGIGFVLHALGDREGVRRCVETLAARADSSGGWDGYTDIIFGAAGTGLFLLAVGECDLAAAAGRSLMGQAIPTNAGCKWSIGGGIDQLMPNFSHGTAGIAYFLASLAGATGDDEFLDAALNGASYLLSVARTGDDTCAVFHYEGGGEDLYPLGWCHGPTGLARLFHRLAVTTGDTEWAEWRDRCARTVRRSGIPERKYPGFWDNLGKCCGSTGVAECFLDLHRLTGDGDHLVFARTMADDIVSRATVDDGGTRWSNFEHRIEPPDLPAQTGAMQGAAGIASFLLNLDGHLNGDDWHIVWPDSPF